MRICHARTKEELGSIPIHVFRTNHISSIVLEERTAVIPIGGTVRLGYHFAPKDADNIDQLCWSADVPGGISVDRRGVVLGLSPGRYRIRLQAGSVSDEGVILVKEKLRGLWLSAERLELTRGEWSSVSYIGEPEDCYPEPIYTYIEDKTVISYADNTVYAEQAGETDLVFYNSSRSVEKRCHIVVREKASEKNDKGKPGLLHGLWDTLAPGKRK